MFSFWHLRLSLDQNKFDSRLVRAVLHGLAVVSILAFSLPSWANEKRVQGRAFVSQLNPDASEFKNEFIKNGIPDLGTYLRLGVDLTYPVLPYLDLGFRYENITAKGPDVYSSSRIQSATATMNSLQALARVPLYKTSFFRVDVFGAYGLSNSEVEFATATQSTKVTGPGGWHPEDSHSSAYGASVAIGYNGYFLYTEAGRTMNINRGLKKSGTLETTYTKYDLSADYIAFGFIYDGDLKTNKK